MTSVLKRYSQIDERTRYLIAEAAVNTYTLRGNVTTGVIDISGILTETVGGIQTGTFLKDLGRVVYVHDPFLKDESPVGPRVAVLRQVQVVNGEGSGGVGGNAANMFKSYWIATWVSIGLTPGRIDLANVSRTG